MKSDQLISIHAFTQSYLHHIGGDALATVYLLIDHEMRQFNILPVMPRVDTIRPDINRMSNYASIDEVAITFICIGADFARAFALQACTMRATLFAIETLALAKPTEIEAAKRLFTDDMDTSLTTHNSQLT